MQLNNYSYVAAGVLVLAIFLSVGNIISGARNPDIEQTIQMVPIGDEESGVLPEAAVLDPLVPAVAGVRALNPFNLEQELAGREATLPLPPPPALTPPAIPMLPLPGEWEER